MVNYLNREASWMDFNERVLCLAEDPGMPLLERAKFLAIFSRNLDEFFQVRVAGLKEQVIAGLTSRSPDGATPGEQLDAIRTRVATLMGRQGHCFNSDLIPGLAAAGIRFSNWDALGEADRTHLDTVFERRIYPVLTPLAVDPAHPFPYISNLSLNLVVVLADPASGERHVARVKVPQLLPRFIVLPDGEGFVPLEQVIAAHLDRLFPGMSIRAHYAFRVTRNADFDLEEDEAEDLLEAVRNVLQRRRVSPLVVRLETEAAMPADVVGLLVRELELDQADVTPIAGPLDLGGLWDLHRLGRADLKDRPYSPVTPRALSAEADEPGAIFRALRDADILVHHPYDSFETTVEAFIEQAAADPSVLAIKQTLYRTSGPVSPIIRSLTRAAETGKQVVALIELTARFDEQANIAWAHLLEETGVHVVYGMVGLKTHAKITLVVRQEGGGIRRYCHVGTGNYNRDTARVYEDIGILSADQELGAELSEFFNSLTGYSREHNYRRLHVAPIGLRRDLLGLIAAQGRPGGAIVIKANSLTDPEIIDALYQAAQSGAGIDLIIRGVCCLRPGRPGLSENITVRSIVGRYLEHSRIFRFGSGDAAQYLIGSADLMSRNLDRRVEVVIPVLAPRLRSRLDEIIEVCLADDRLAWQLDATGAWHRVPPGTGVTGGVNAHDRLEELAVGRVAVVPPWEL